MSLLSFRRIVISIISGAASMAAANPVASGLKLTSSMLWQPNDKQVYFPGIPAVLPQEALRRNRHFRLEAYVIAPSNNDLTLIPKVVGPWQTNDPSLGMNGQDANQAKVGSVVGGRSQCEGDISYDGEGNEIGFRCYWDFFVGEETPSGVIAISAYVADGVRELRHPNLNFVIIVPEGAGGGGVFGLANPKQNDSGDQDQSPKPKTPDEVLNAANYVVQINLGGNLSIGTGFLVGDLSTILPKFTGFRFRPRGLDSSRIYVITAAHVVPFFDPRKSIYNQFQIGDGIEQHQTYDIVVKGSKVSDAVELVAEDMASDIAILAVRDDPEVVASILESLNLSHIQEFVGLAFAPTVHSGAGCVDDVCQIYWTLGYPAASDGALMVKGSALKIGNYPTVDTSNFGHVPKFKLRPLSVADDSLLAPSGVSGGPVVNDLGLVVGMATERPVAENALIAVDMSNQSGADNPEFGPRCYYTFNPFLRRLLLVSTDLACRYGNFGEKLPGGTTLDGEWLFQEVVGLVSESESSQLLRGGQAFVNGHAIINGHGIINGHAIIKGFEGSPDQFNVIYAEDVHRINGNLFSNGYHLNPDSFRIMETRGVRVLGATSLEPDVRCQIEGKLISGYRNVADGRTFRIYSMREFLIWLHRNVDRSDWYKDLVIHGAEIGC